MITHAQALRHRALAGALVLLGLVTAAGADELPLQTLHRFSNRSGPHTPDGGPTVGADGALYGTTFSGTDDLSNGIVWQIASGSTDLVTLHAFTGQDGSGPNATLVQAPDGNFYGVTWAGGSFRKGTVFRVGADGSFRTLHSFSGKDGAYPSARLLLASDGKLYGTTNYGGPADCGVIFRLGLGGDFAVVHPMTLAEGEGPSALTEGADGELYGSAGLGGGVTLEFGTLFKVSIGGALTVLHAFETDPPSSIWNPASPLTPAADGNFYGYALSTSKASQSGAFYRMSPDGTVRVLHDYPTALGVPSGEFVPAPGGGFYGTTSGGNTGGTVYTIDTGGSVTTLHAFKILVDGAFPESALAVSPGGRLYGTTQGFGENKPRGGSIFTLEP